MLNAELQTIFSEVLFDRRLLSHPFYQRWEAGELKDSELGAYASQYRHFESSLPSTLAKIVNHLTSNDAKQARWLVQANLEDELHTPAPHISLFDKFAESVHADEGQEATAGTKALLGVYQNLSNSDPIAALAALAAYEIQASDIACSKAEGLRAHYGIDDEGTEFWDVHGTMDQVHADWALRAIGALIDNESPLEASASIEKVKDSARQAADAWWAFLDEREALAPQLQSA